MATFRIDVGIDTVTSTKNMEAELKSIIRTLNKKSYEIDVSFSSQGIKKMQQQLSSAVKSVKLDSISSAAMDSLNKATKETNSSLTTMGKSVQNVKQQLADVATQGNTTLGVIKELKSSMSAINTSYKSLSKSLGGATATGTNASDLENLRTAYINLQNAVEGVYAKGTSASQEELANARQLQTVYQSLADSITNRLTTEQSAVSQLSAELKTLQTTFKSISSSYEKTSSSLIGLNGNATGGEDVETLNALKQGYTELQAIMEQINSSEGAVSQEDITKAKELQTTVQSLINASQAYIDEQRQEAAQVAASTKEHQQKIAVEKQYYNIIAQIDKALKSYTAAEKSSNTSSQEAYSSIQRLSDELRGAFTQYSNGSLKVDEFKKRIASATTTFKENTNTIKANGDATKTFAERMDNLVNKFSSWLSASQLVMSAIRGVRQMISASIALEDAMAQLQIVTKATDEEFSSFLSEAVSLAKELGQTVTDVVGSIETFSRLGYDFEDASSLAEYATILANIADTDVDTATTGLTSIIKGYSLEASDAEHIADVLVTVGQEYAISAEELMAAFERGGAALAASGTSFEKSAALFAATNASLQNAESTGTLWKTVSARIRGATTELEELGESTDDCADGLSKYRDEIMSLTGVDIMINDNTYKDVYDIFVELAEVWDGLSDTASARVAEILGGTRQLSGISSTITNISDAIGAYESATESAGAATEANAIYMDTATAHLKQLKAAFQAMSADLADSGLIKNVLDIGTTVLEVVDDIGTAIGGIPTIIGVLGGVASIKGEGELINQFQF